LEAELQSSLRGSHSWAMLVARVSRLPYRPSGIGDQIKGVIGQAGVVDEMVQRQNGRYVFLHSELGVP